MLKAQKSPEYRLNLNLPFIPALTVDLIWTELNLFYKSPSDVPERVLVDEVAGWRGRVLLLPTLAVVAHLLLSEDSVPHVEVKYFPEERSVVIIISPQSHHQRHR